MRIVFRYLAMQDVVDFALATLRERSPVGSKGDKHPGLYRDSHMVFRMAMSSRAATSAPGGLVIRSTSRIPFRMRARSRWAAAR
jgi:hypothetical protein